MLLRFELRLTHVCMRHKRGQRHRHNYIIMIIVSVTLPQFVAIIRSLKEHTGYSSERARLRMSIKVEIIGVRVKVKLSRI
mmetsp:Transcript_22103/g.39188  ORF Transcript_22103/g.39188 Transcript_22103/m.39188 type:complete len:80 (+) Transcript_22103:919-1158(+)